MRRVLQMTLLAILCGGLTVDPAARAQSNAEVKSLYQTMARLYREENYSGALAMANELYRKTKRPTLRVNIARCHDKLGQTLPAVRFYRRYLNQQRAANALTAGVR